MKEIEKMANLTYQDRHFSIRAVDHETVEINKEMTVEIIHLTNIT